MPKSTLDLWHRQQLDWFIRSGFDVNDKSLDQLVSELPNATKFSLYQKEKPTLAQVP